MEDIAMKYRERAGGLMLRAFGGWRLRTFGRSTPRAFSLWCVLVVLLGVFTCSPLDAQAPAKPVAVVGTFLNVKYIADDAVGYSLRLWKQGNQIFGLLSVYTGPPSDPPTGILEDVKFDPRTRKFSFSARLSTGLVSGRGYSRVPSRDRFSFSGVLTGKEVSGVLKHADELFPGDRPESKGVRLKYSKALTEDMHPAPATYAEWKVWADEVLERRGPKQ
jgi:hypothetical protein